MKRIDDHKHRLQKIWNGRRRAAGCLLAVALLAGAAAPGRAVGPRVKSKSERIEIPETFIVAPEMSPIPRPLIDMRAAGVRPLSRGWFGIGLSCSECGISLDDSTGTTVWSLSEPPKIHHVDPDGPAGKAGLRRGDKLIQIDGMPITSREGGRRFGAIEPGDEVRWIYERNGKKKEVTLVAEAHPDRELFVVPEVTADVEAALAELRRGKPLRLGEPLRVGKPIELEESLLRTEDLEELREEVWKDQVEAAREALERASDSLRRQGYIVSSAGNGVETVVIPSKRQNLRYEGTLAGSEIEVLGSGSVVVTENRDDGELLITTPDATIRIRKSK